MLALAYGKTLAVIYSTRSFLDIESSWQYVFVLEVKGSRPVLPSLYFHVWLSFREVSFRPGNSVFLCVSCPVPFVSVYVCVFACLGVRVSIYSMYCVCWQFMFAPASVLFPASVFPALL